MGSIAGFDRSVFSGGSKDLGDAVTKIDDHTVQIKQSSDNALLLTVLAIYSMAPFDSAEMKKHASPKRIRGATSTPTPSTHRALVPIASKPG